MKHSLLLVCFLALFRAATAQNAVYTANGNKLEGAQLTDVTDDKISFIYQNQVRSFQRQNILFAFRQNGNYLTVNELDRDLARAKQQLQTFLSAPPRTDGLDYLIKAVPLTVVPGKISYENAEVVNYRTATGQAASLPKRELVAVLYSDGKHALLRPDYSEVASLLADARDKIRPDAAPVSQAVTSASAEKSVPVTATTPENKPVASDPTPAVIPVSAPTIVPTEDSRMVLSEAERLYYRKKALQKVDEFVTYLNTITNKALPLSVRDQAIVNAAKLFMPAATMEVTSKNRPGSRRYPIAEYLTRLKLLPYSYTQIEWTEVAFIKELTQATDGNYYGMVTGEQRFTGYGRTVVYEDIVQKNVRVKVTKPDSAYDRWDLQLGSIGVSHQ